MRKNLLCTMAALCAALVLPAAAQTRAENVVKVVMHAPMRVLDPIFSDSYITRNHAYLVYDTLFALDEAGRPQPQMVDSFNLSADKRTYTFNLRPGLKFHDGTDVTADDVIASLQRWGQRDVLGKRLAEATEQMTAVNAKTFTIRTRKPYDMMLDSLAKPSSPVPFIMPRRIAQTPHTTAITDAVGSGPFRFVPAEFQPGVKAVYAKFNDYVPRKEKASNFAGGKTTNIDRLEVVSVPDGQTAVNALKKGEIDYIETVAPDLVTQLTDVKNIKAEPKVNVQSMYLLRMNWLQPPLDNVKVRRAVMSALYQVDYLEASIGDSKRYKVCGAILTCASPYKSDEGAPQVKKPDLEKVRQIVRESGYKGEKIVVMHSTDLRSMLNIAPVTAQALRSAGFNVEMQSTDWSTMLARRDNKGPVDKGGWSIYHTYVSTLDLMHPLSNKMLDASGSLPGWPTDKAMDELREQFADASGDKQAEVAKALQKRAYELVFYVPLGEGREYRAFNAAKMEPLADAQALVFWSAAK